MQKRTTTGNVSVVPEVHGIDAALVDGVVAVERARELSADGRHGVRVPEEVGAPCDGLHEALRVVEAPQGHRKPVDAVRAKVVRVAGEPVVHRPARQQGCLHPKLAGPPVPALLRASLRLRCSQQARHFVAAFCAGTAQGHELLDNTVQEVSGQEPIFLARDGPCYDVAQEGGGRRGGRSRVRGVRRLRGALCRRLGVPGEEHRHGCQPHQSAIARVLRLRLISWRGVLIWDHDSQRLRNVAAKANGTYAIIIPKGVVVASEPPVVKADAHVRSIITAPCEQSVSQAEAHGSVVGPLSALDPKSIPWLDVLELFKVKHRLAISNFIHCVDELEGSTKRVPHCHPHQGTHGTGCLWKCACRFDEFLL
mmetsp:Transcript_107938/g.315634  ORF Transcript_107938/g.315634 Transcript_107938/m.315634 type:complete len:366 (+) Transcript_107938:124-1221(+)